MTTLPAAAKIVLTHTSDLDAYGAAGEMTDAAWREKADALMVEYLENQGYEVVVATDRAKRSAIDFIDEDGARIETAQAEEAAAYLLRAAWDFTCQA